MSLRISLVCWRWDARVRRLKWLHRVGIREGLNFEASLRAKCCIDSRDWESETVKGSQATKHAILEGRANNGNII